MNKQSKTLEQRIVAALQPDAASTSVDVAALIEETEEGIAKADKESGVDETLSLDPKTARQAIADATFAAKRLRTLLSKLQALYQQVHDGEQVTTWLAEYEALKPERDALAEELRELYPSAVNKIVDLFARITNNDNALSELHQARPAGVMQRLLSAELHGRGLNSFSRDMPSLRTSVVLFDWDNSRQIWPPRRPSLAAAFAASMVPAYDDGRFTADWAKDDERRVAAVRVEQQRVADYYVRLTREQEERENAEARERFAAGQRKNSV
jgi:hypothetical protein